MPVVQGHETRYRGRSGARRRTPPPSSVQSLGHVVDPDTFALGPLQDRYESCPKQIGIAWLAETEALAEVVVEVSDAQRTSVV